MALFKAGREFGFLLLAFIMLSIVYYMRRGLLGKVPKLRRLPQIDASDEIVRRCVEMGRPVWFIPQGNLRSTSSIPASLATLGILQYVATRAAELEATFQVNTSMPVPSGM